MNSNDQLLCQIKSCEWLQSINSAWKVSVFGVVLVQIFPHSDQNNSEYGHFLRSVI